MGRSTIAAHAMGLHRLAGILLALGASTSARGATDPGWLGGRASAGFRGHAGDYLSHGPAPRQAARPGEVLVVDLIDNGSGALANDAPPGDPRSLLVPWWIATPPFTAAPAKGALEVGVGRTLTQPFAAFAPLAAGVVVQGRVAGRGRVRLLEGGGGALELEVADGPFELRAADFDARLGRPAAPRFLLELGGLDPAAPARFTGVRALVPLPLASETETAEELARFVDGVFREWLERAIDREGPRATPFLTGRFDALTGERLSSDPNGIHPLYECLLDAAAVRDEPRWREALTTFLEAFLELSFHPVTGLPREWDGVRDVPLDEKGIEIARYLAFLLDVDERGPKALRARALERAGKIAAHVLERGRLGDGTIAVKYVPASGAADLAAQPIRRLDVAAQLARLGRRLGDASMVAAANAALADFTYLLYWGGTWERIDPDFDDSWGTWGGKATLMLAASPEDPLLAGFVGHGFEHFAPLWRDAARFGGSMAADQVRCWDLSLRYASLRPAARPRVDELLADAVRAHFKGEQYTNGAWGDVTFAAFSPRATLNVGDFSGTPANLLTGLACAYRPGSALRTDATRAMFLAVLRSSSAAYARPHGWLSTREEQAGHNLAFGELRAAIGAVEMLECLAR